MIEDCSYTYNEQYAAKLIMKKVSIKRNFSFYYSMLLLVTNTGILMYNNISVVLVAIVN